MNDVRNHVESLLAGVGQDLVTWFIDAAVRLPRLRDHVTVERLDGRSEVDIDFLFPGPGSATARYRITTRGTFHLPAAFGWGGGQLNSIRRESRGRGRAIYCIDLEARQVIAAVGYHVDDQERLPVLLRAVASLQHGAPSVMAVSRGTAVVLLALLQVIAEKLNRPHHIDFNAPNRPAWDECTPFGFRRATLPYRFPYRRGYAYGRLPIWWK